MTLVKFLDGSILAFTAVDMEELTQQVTEYINGISINSGNDNNKRLVQLIKVEDDEKNDEQDDDMDIQYFALIHPTRTLLILNRTQGNYFSYEREYVNDKGYEYILRQLFQRDLQNDSHWMATDQIVFVPDDLHEYVQMMYGKLFV